MLAVAVLDGVDDRLAHGDADPVHGILVEPAEVAMRSQTIWTKSSMSKLLGTWSLTVPPRFSMQGRRTGTRADRRGRGGTAAATGVWKRTRMSSILNRIDVKIANVIVRKCLTRQPTRPW